MREIKDIKDELHTMKVIFEDQKGVLEKLGQVLYPSPGHDGDAGTQDALRMRQSQLQKTIDLVTANISEVEDIDKHAGETYKAACNI